MIESFINQFSKYPDTTKCFTCGMCYWFAHILYHRFYSEQLTVIMYDPVANHFGCKIDKEVYDITGIVTDKYNWQKWEDYKMIDPLHTSRICRDCIRKEVI